MRLNRIVVSSGLAIASLSGTACRVEAGPPPPQQAPVYYQPAPPAPPVQEQVVYTEQPPPPPAPEVEVVPVSPGPDFVWLSGYHRWDGGRYAWVRGHYDRRPRPAARWEQPHWEGRGRGHVWVEGRWR